MEDETHPELEMAKRLFADGCPVVVGRGRIAVAGAPLPFPEREDDADYITALFSRGSVEWLAIGDADGLIWRYDHEDIARDPTLAAVIVKAVRRAYAPGGLAEMRRQARGR